MYDPQEEDDIWWVCVSVYCILSNRSLTVSGKTESMRRTECTVPVFESSESVFVIIEFIFER